MTSRKTILHADDVARWRDYVRELLSSDYSVESVEDCDAVMPRLSEGGVDLVILDHLMPGSGPVDTGYEVCQQIRSTQPDLPIIIYSGAWDDTEVNRDELEGKCGAMIVFKDTRDPSLDDLVARVKSLLEN